MPNIQLDTGMTIWVSTFEYYFKLKDEDMELFFQSCKADNLGIYIDNPFSGSRFMGKIEEEKEDIPIDPIEPPDWEI